VEKVELKFSYKKETKNTIRYQEEAHSSKDIAVGSLYIQKECLGDPPPRRLRVVIEEDT